MTKRLKTTIIYTLLLLRVELIALFLLEIAVAAFVLIFGGVWEKQNFYAGGDTVILVFMLVYGISFYEKHTALCNSNAVSEKYRLISQLAVTAPAFVLAAAADCIIRSLLVDVKAFSTSEFVRYLISDSFIVNNNLLLSFVESASVYAFVFSLGFILCALRRSKSDRFVLLTLFVTALVLVLSALFGSVSHINPIVWLFGVIVNLLISNAVSTVIACILLTAAMILAAYRMSFGVKLSKEDN